MYHFLGVNLVRTFRGDVVKKFSSIWSYANENEQKL